MLFENGAVQDLGTLGGRTSQSTGINDAGQIIGYSLVPSGNSDLNSDGRVNNLDIAPFTQLLLGASASQVPEPDNLAHFMWLTAAGVWLLAGYHRRGGW